MPLNTAPVRSAGGAPVSTSLSSELLGGLDVGAIFAHDSVVRARYPIGTFWPSALQEKLLIVALGDCQTAVTTWQELRPRISLDELELGSFELLPLIYRNLSLGGHADADLPRLKGVYRRSWVKNNLLSERTKEIHEILAEIGIQAVFIEGVLLASRFYPTLGLRPTSSIDVLVDGDGEAAALAELARAGWKEKRSPPPGRVRLRHLYQKDGQVCVFRTRLAVDFMKLAGRRRESLREAIDRYTVVGVEVRVPRPAETLFAICVLHARPEGVPNIQWIADAKMVLGAEIDWHRLLALADESRQILRLQAALDYLAGLPGSTPSQEARDRLAEVKVTKRERIAYICTAGSIWGSGPLSSLIAEHVSATESQSILDTTATIPSFLRDRWNLDHTWQVPVAAGRRAMRPFRARRRAV